MSITFFIKGADLDSPAVNVSNSNAAELLEFLGLYEQAMDLAGEVRAKDMYLRCQQALDKPQLEEANQELVSTTEQGTGGAWLINCGRRSGYIEEKLRLLQQVAKAAGELGVICFS